jgi:hypothetical protein
VEKDFMKLILRQIEDDKEILNRLEAKLLKISEPQRLILNLMKYTSFNNFDGVLIAKNLIHHCEFWDALIMERQYATYITDQEIEGGHNFVKGINLIKLRDLHPSVEKRLGFPTYNVDTLFILTAHPIKIKNLCKKYKWGASTIEILSRHESSKILGGFTGLNKKTRIVRVWWD